EGVLLAVEDARRPAVLGPLVPGHLHYRSFGSERPAEDDETAVGRERRARRDDDLLPLRLGRRGGMVLPRLAVRRARRTVERTAFQQAIHEQLRSPCTIEI